MLFFFDNFVFVLFYLSFLLYDELAFDFSSLRLFGSDRQLPVLLSEFKRLMRWRRRFSISLSFSLTTPITYYFMFAFFTAGFFLMACFVDYVAAVVSFFSKAVYILFVSLLSAFYCWY